jgi:hypothetical protein
LAKLILETEQEFDLWAVETTTSQESGSSGSDYSHQHHFHQQTYRSNFSASQIIETESQQLESAAESKASAEKIAQRLKLPFLLLDVRERSQYEQSHIITGKFIFDS